MYVNMYIERVMIRTKEKVFGTLINNDKCNSGG